MSKCDDVRRLALALPGVEEVGHWGVPAFRTKRRIFITLRPLEQKAMFHLTEEHQEILFEARPEAFEPLHWGKVTRAMLNLKRSGCASSKLWCAKPQTKPRRPCAQGVNHHKATGRRARLFSFA